MAECAHPIRLGILLGAAAIVCACSEPADPPAPKARALAAADDGTYLKRIDPLGGAWRVEQIKGEDFQQYQAWISFSEGGFLTHGAGCRGGYPAFYQINGPALAVSRREPIQTGKCGGRSGITQKAAAASEHMLGSFLDQTIAWSQSDTQTLILVTGTGARAVLTKPTEPYPQLAGHWLIHRIGDQPFVTESRSPILSIAMGSIQAYADCNSMGTAFTASAGGQMAVGGSILSTLIRCLPEDAAEDDLMARAISSAKAYRFEGEQLHITGDPGMVLLRPPEPNRALVGQYELCGNTLLGAVHEGPVTLTIDEYSMRDNAGCTAGYSVAGPNLSLRLSSGRECANTAPPYEPGEPAAIGGQISTLAVARPNGFAFNDSGQLILRTGRGLLSMCRAGAERPFGH